MGHRRHRRGMRKRYGRSYASGSAITRPRADGKVDVILVDSKGGHLQTLARGVPYERARDIIRKRHH